ncbi:hypothetical protein RhiirA4_432001, partial [Rhizophagus irregularis]
MSYNTSDKEEFYDAMDMLETETIHENSTVEDFDSNISDTNKTHKITAIFGKNLETWDIEYHFEFKEYPRTSEMGVATVFNVDGWNTERVIQEKYQQSKNHPFLGTACKREFRTCQEVKICKFASLQILEGEHTTVDFENEYYKELFNQEEYNSRDLALCQFVAAHKFSCKFIDSNTNSVGNSFFIGCAKWDWRNPQTGHRYIPISDTRIDMGYLDELFKNFEFCSAEEFDKRDDLDLSQIKNCNTILHCSSRQITCRFPHLIGNIVIESPIISQKCNVQFNSFVPEDLKCSPFIAIVSKGVHCHLPPPPVTTPYEKFLSNTFRFFSECIENIPI